MTQPDSPAAELRAAAAQVAVTADGLDRMGLTNNPQRALAELFNEAAAVAAANPDLAADHDRSTCELTACRLLGRAIALARSMPGTAR